MTFQKYQTGNNVVGFLDAGLSASGTTMIMKSEYAELFPTHAGGATKDYLLTLEQIDTVTKAVLKREIVKVKGRAGNIFTIERGAGICPGSDTATAQGNNSYPFSSGDKVILSITAENDKDIKDELERLEVEKKNDFDFADIPLSSLKDGPSETPANNEYLKWNEAEQRYEPGVIEGVDIPEVSNFSLISEYPLGEDILDITKSCLFKETTPTFAQATSTQNIGDVVANTRVSFPAIGTGVASNTLKLALAKNGSPSLFLRVRIETDNAGSPSGTLVDQNATKDIDPSTLTTSLADTTVTFPSNITTANGTKVHIVVSVVGDIVNGSNYYKIGYSENDTTTRPIKLWDGSSWGYIASQQQTDTVSTNGGVSGANTTNTHTIIPKYDIYLLSMTSGRSMSGGGYTNIISTTPNIQLLKGTQYIFTKSGYGEYYPGPATSNNVTINSVYPVGLMIETFAITTIKTTKKPPYISSTLFTPTVLSLTSSPFSYKVDLYGIATAIGAAGSYPKVYLPVDGAIIPNFTGMTEGAIQFLSSTPGGISSNVGILQIGKAFSQTRLGIKKKIISLPITVGTSPFTRQNTTGSSLQYYVSGGTVNPIQISKDGTTYITQSTATGYIGTLAPGDYLKVTYTVLPTITYSEL